MVTTASLISTVRAESAYDLDLPCANPDTGISDNEILALLNQAQDDLGMYFRGFAYQVPLNITSSAPVTPSTIESSTGVRFAGFDTVRVSGYDIGVRPLSERTSLDSVAAFSSSGSLIVLNTSYPVAVNVSGPTAPTTLVLGGTCSLDDAFARLHLPRYAIYIGAAAHITEPQQLQRIETFKENALSAARSVGNVVARLISNRQVPRHSAF